MYAKSPIEDGRQDAELKTSLLDKVTKAGWIVILCLFICGCQTRTVYIPEGEPVRLSTDIPNAKVWVKDAKGTVKPSTVTLKEGWFVLSDTREKNNGY